MSISLISQPSTIHSSGNSNWWSWNCSLSFAPKFNLKAYIMDASIPPALYNTVLIPTNPSTFNILNIKNIIDDYVLPTFNYNINTPTIATVSVARYMIQTAETIEGLFITASSVGGKVGNLNVVNNNQLKHPIITPALIEDIGFTLGLTTSYSPLFVYGGPGVQGYSYSSTGYINSFSMSSSDTSYQGVTWSIGNAEGYIILTSYTVFSEGPTTSTDIKYAVQSNIEYLDYNSSNNYSGYFMNGPTGKFLTKSPRSLDIQEDEYSTLSFLQGTTYSSNLMYVVDNLGLTYSKGITGSHDPFGRTQSIRIDIPTGTRNLGITSSASYYDVRLLGGSTSSTVMSETFRYYINCLDTYWDTIRLCWLNSLGGIDYYSFKFTSSSGRKISRSNFDRNLTQNTTISDRGLTTYKLYDYDEYTVVSNPLDDDDSEWLVELSTSLEVYWIRNSVLIPITLIGDVYNRNVGLENYEATVNFRLSRTNKK